MSALLIAIIVLPLLSAAVLGLFRNTWSKSLVSLVACSSVAVSFAMVLALLVQYNGTHEPIRHVLTSWGPILTFGLMADALSLWWMVVVTGCGLLIHIYATSYMHDDPSFGRFMAKLNFFIYAMSLLVLADNFVGLLMGWANVGLASYMLIGFYVTKPAASAASMKAFVINMIGEAGMIAGIAFIYFTYGTFDFSGVFEQVNAGHGLMMLNLIGILLLVGAAAKSAQFPLHTWLPNAMEGPTPVSALIHAATMVTAGVYLVSRAWPIYANAALASDMVAWVGAIGALMGAAIACKQYDIKRILAFSTLSQVGYMFLANGVGAYVAADFHFFTHAFFKACLFLTAGIVVHHFHGDQDIRRMGGVWHMDKAATIIFGVATAALIGLPFTAGFFSKDEILLAAFEANKPLFAVALLAAGLTAFYNIRLFSLVFLGKQWTPTTKAVGKKKKHHAEADHGHGHGHGHHEHHATPIAQLAPVAILAVLSVVSGWLALVHHAHFEFLKPSFEGLDMAVPKIEFWLAATVTTLALIAGGISYYLYGPNGIRREAERDVNAEAGALTNMLYFDTIYDTLFVQPAKALAAGASTADAKGVDGVVDGSGKLAAALGGVLRHLQNGFIRRYALTIFAGVTLVLAYYLLI